MSGYVDLAPQAEAPRPRESALGVVLRRPAGGPIEVLFGRRSPRSRFMPGHLAFPGGRLDEADEPARDGAHARCASRELLEETGLAIPAQDWLAVGERTTPPMFPVRFRTLFFVGALPAGAQPPAVPPRPEEIDLLRFAPAGVVLKEWERGQALVPPPCLPILRTLAAADEREPLASLAERLLAVNHEQDELPQIEFQPGIWVLPVRTRTIPPATHTNVWMPGGERFVLFDPGSDRPEELGRLRRLVDRRREGGVPLESIVLTHHHPDHISGAAALARTLDVPVAAHPRTLETLAAPAGVATREIRDGDVIDLGGVTLRTLHTPGHAVGHLAFEVPERDAVIAGDLLSGFSTILIHPDEGDMGDYLASLRRIRDTGRSRMLPAHGPPLPARAVERVIDHRGDREGRVLRGLSTAWKSVAEIAERAYSETPSLPALLREGQTLAHLRHLERQGTARRHPERAELWALTADRGSRRRPA